MPLPFRPESGQPACHFGQVSLGQGIQRLGGRARNAHGPWCCLWACRPTSQTQGKSPQHWTGHGGQGRRALGPGMESANAAAVPVPQGPPPVSGIGRWATYLQAATPMGTPIAVGAPRQQRPCTWVRIGDSTPNGFAVTWGETGTRTAVLLPVWLRLWVNGTSGALVPPPPPPKGRTGAGG